MKRTKLLIIIGGLVLVLTAVELIVCYRLAAAGEEVRRWENRSAELEQQNRILTTEISQTGSLAKISSQAQDLGFVRSTQVWHLTSQIPVALK